MDQKFISFDEALDRLGLTSERLNALREHGQLRAYRDGKSWKFRANEIEAMVTEGVPELPPPSDVSLVDPEELVAAEPLAEESADLELELLDEDAEDADLPSAASPKVPLPLDDADVVSADSSEFEINELEDTITIASSDLDLADDTKDSSDSILLSEEELGVSISGSPSTIIGKSELLSEDADLELASEETAEDPSGQEENQDPSASDVLSTGVVGSGVLDDLTGSSGGAFEDLEELEIDLEAESSRILAPGDVAPSQLPEASASDLILEEDSELVGDADLGSTDVPRETVETDAGEAAGADLELATDDEVLSEDPSSSDMTLSSGDSGINLSPADSGLALDDIPLDMGGSAILSSLALEGSDPEISLVGNDTDASGLPEAELQTDDDFQLTPMREGEVDEEGDSSSQVIALDDELEQFGEESLGGLEAVDFAEEGAAGMMLSEDFAAAPADDLGVSYGAAPAAEAEPPVTVGNVLLLGSCGVVLLLACTMGVDLVRNMWGWNENLALNSSLMEAILSLLP